MPLTSKGKKILNNMKREYGAEKGQGVFYASINKGTLKGVEQKQAYAQGFADKCAAAGIDPAQLLKWAYVGDAETAKAVQAALQSIAEGQGSLAFARGAGDQGLGGGAGKLALLAGLLGSIAGGLVGAGANQPVFGARKLRLQPEAAIGAAVGGGLGALAGGGAGKLRTFISNAALHSDLRANLLDRYAASKGTEPYRAGVLEQMQRALAKELASGRIKQSQAGKQPQTNAPVTPSKDEMDQWYARRSVANTDPDFAVNADKVPAPKATVKAPLKVPAKVK